MGLETKGKTDDKYNYKVSFGYSSFYYLLLLLSISLIRGDRFLEFGSVGIKTNFYLIYSISFETQL